MIVGIGLDLIESENFEKRVQRTPTIAHTILKLTTLSPTDSSLPQKSDLRRHRINELAMSNLAAFEALLKASTEEIRSQISNFKLCRADLGKPEFVFTGQDSQLLSNLRINLTITNQQKFTLALVIIEKLV